MNNYMIVFSDGVTEIYSADSIASIAFMNDDIEWDYVVAVFRID